MPLTQKDIDELKAVHYRVTGEELTNDEAWEMGMSLMKFFTTLYKDQDQKGGTGKSLDDKK